MCYHNNNHNQMVRGSHWAKCLWWSALLRVTWVRRLRPRINPKMAPRWRATVESRSVRLSVYVFLQPYMYPYKKCYLNGWYQAFLLFPLLWTCLNFNSVIMWRQTGQWAVQKCRSPASWLPAMFTTSRECEHTHIHTHTPAVRSSCW